MEAPPEAASEAPFPWTATIISALLLGTMLAQRLINPMDMDPDCAMYLRGGQAILQGAVPYVDFVDLNPPLIMYLNTIPAAVSAWTGMSLPNAFSTSVWALSVGSFCLAALVLKKALAQRIVSVEIVTALLMVIPAIPLIQMTSFGQREYLLWLGFVPYFLLRWWRWNGGKPGLLTSVPIGVLAGLMIALKPAFLLLPASIELYWIIKQRTARNLLSPEVFSAAAMEIAYLAHFALIPASMRTAFFDHVLPIVARGYAYYSHPKLLLAVGIFLHAPFLLVVLPSAFLLRKRSSIIEPLLVLWLAGAITYVSHIGSLYHTVPMYSAGLMLLAVFFALVVKFKKAYWVILGLLALISLPLFVTTHFNKSADNDPLYTQTILERTKPGDGVAIWTTYEPPVGMHLLSDRALGSRYPHLFPLILIEFMKRTSKDSSDLTQLEKQAQYVRHQLVEDLQQRKPKLIFLNHKNLAGTPQGWAFDEAVLSDPPLKALIDSNYTEEKAVGNFRIFVRR